MHKKIKELSDAKNERNEPPPLFLEKRKSLFFNKMIEIGYD